MLHYVCLNDLCYICYMMYVTGIFGIEINALEQTKIMLVVFAKPSGMLPILVGHHILRFAGRSTFISVMFNWMELSIKRILGKKKVFKLRKSWRFIRKTCPYNVYPLYPTFI